MSKRAAAVSCGAHAVTVAGLILTVVSSMLLQYVIGLGSCAFTFVRLEMLWIFV